MLKYQKEIFDWWIMVRNEKNKDVCMLVGSADYFAERAPDRDSAYVIALDGGYAHLTARAIIPDAVIGDFDSLGYIPDFEGVTVLPRVKDDTDSFWAAKGALWQGYRHFYLVGCTGGERPEHTVANISLMLYLVRHGAVSVIMEGERQMYRVVSAPCRIEFEGEKGNFSAFSLSERTFGVTMRGFEYETDRITLCSDIPLGVSNHFDKDKCALEAEKGDLLLIWDK